MTMGVYTDDSSRYPCDDDILEAAPENPVRFLADSELAWKAMVDGIEDLERLEAYRQAEKRHIERENPSDKVDVHKYIDKRERELTGSVSDPTPEATPDPVAATDGGEVVDYDDIEDADEPVEPEPEPEQTQPDARGLEAGEVLVVDRGAKTEFVYPTNAKSDSPYISRAHDEDGKLWMELEIDEEDYRSRLAQDPDHESIDEIDVDAPRKAATGGEN